jgi:hypothetical protein
MRISLLAAWAVTLPLATLAQQLDRPTPSQATLVQLRTNYLRGVPLSVQSILQHETVRYNDFPVDEKVERQARIIFAQVAAQVTPAECVKLLNELAKTEKEASGTYLKVVALTGGTPEYSSDEVLFQQACDGKLSSTQIRLSPMRSILIGVNALVHAHKTNELTKAGTLETQAQCRSILMRAQMIAAKKSPALAKEIRDAISAGKVPTETHIDKLVQFGALDRELVLPRTAQPEEATRATGVKTLLRNTYPGALKEFDKACPSTGCSSSQASKIEKASTAGTNAVKQASFTFSEELQAVGKAAQDAKTVFDAYQGVRKVVGNASADAESQFRNEYDKALTQFRNSDEESRVRGTRAGNMSLSEWVDLPPSEKLRALDTHPFFRNLGPEDRQALKEDINKALSAESVYVGMGEAKSYLKSAGSLIQTAAKLGIMDPEQAQSAQQAISLAIGVAEVAQGVALGYLSGNWLPGIASVGSFLSSGFGGSGSKPDPAVQMMKMVMDELRKVQQQLREISGKLDDLRQDLMSRLDRIENKVDSIMSLQAEGMVMAPRRDCRAVWELQSKFDGQPEGNFTSFNARARFIHSVNRNDGPNFVSCDHYINAVAAPDSISGFPTTLRFSSWGKDQNTAFEFPETRYDPFHKFTIQTLSIQSSTPCRTRLYAYAYARPVTFSAMRHGNLPCAVTTQLADFETPANIGLDTVAVSNILKTPFYLPAFEGATEAIIATSPFTVLREGETEDRQRLLLTETQLAGMAAKPLNAGPYWDLAQRFAYAAEVASRGMVSEVLYSGALITKVAAKQLRDKGFGHMPRTLAELNELETRIKVLRQAATLPSNQQVALQVALSFHEARSATYWLGSTPTLLAKRKKYDELVAQQLPDDAAKYKRDEVDPSEWTNVMLLNAAEWHTLWSDFNFHARTQQAAADEERKWIAESASGTSSVPKDELDRRTLAARSRAQRAGQFINDATQKLEAHRVKAREGLTGGSGKTAKTAYEVCEFATGGDYARLMCFLSKNAQFQNNLATYLVLETLDGNGSSLSAYGAARVSPDPSFVEKVLPGLPLVWDEFSTVWQLSIAQPWGDGLLIDLPDIEVASTGAIAYTPAMKVLRERQALLREQYFFHAVPINHDEFLGKDNVKLGRLLKGGLYFVREAGQVNWPLKLQGTVN